jgi:polyhydroxyalkanoate synthesis repressor PhaR
VVTIKRYSNRKLYNTETKRYITLEGLRSLIQESTEIQVIDHLSGEDLTTLTLTQIIVECTRRADGLFTRQSLFEMIRLKNKRLETVSEAQKTPEINRSLIDQEIRLRVRTLLDNGELDEIEAEHILRRLVDRFSVSPDDAWIEAWVENYLTTSQTPRRADLPALSQKLEKLGQKLVEISS